MILEKKNLALRMPDPCRADTVSDQNDFRAYAAKFQTTDLRRLIKPNEPEPLRLKKSETAKSWGYS